MIDKAERLLDNYATGRMSRREAACALVGLTIAPFGTLAAGHGAGSAEPAEPDESTFRATALNHLGLRVTDVARSRDFYQKHLGVSVIRDSAPGNCFLSVGDNYMGLFRSSTPAIDHFCFTVEGYEANDAVAKLRKVGLSSRMEEDRVYFNDPDGLEVQLDSPFGSWPGPRPTGTG